VLANEALQHGLISGERQVAWNRRIAVCSIIFLVALGMVVYLYRLNLARELKEQATPLIAATLPSPVSSNCPIPRGAVALYLGNSVSVVTNFPQVVFRVHGEDVFVLDRDSSDLLISFRVFDDRGNAVARLERNTFVATNSASHVENAPAFHSIDPGKVVWSHFSTPSNRRWWQKPVCQRHR